MPFITKVLIIREEWPDLYYVLKSNSYLLENIYNNINVKEDIYSIDNFVLNSEQRNFLRRTNHIKPNHNNFELFFINKDSFKDIPDKTNNLVESNDIEEIKVQLENNEIKFDKLIEFIDTKFETAFKRGELKTTIVNLTSLVFGLSIDEELKKHSEKYIYNSSKFLGGFKSFISSPKVNETLSFIESKYTLGFIKEYPSLSDNILKSFYTLINNFDNSQEILIDFIETFKTSLND